MLRQQQATNPPSPIRPRPRNGDNMQNFQFFNPVRIHFGAGAHRNLPNEIPAEARVLVLYGGGSVLKNGTLDDVRAALGERYHLEFGGIEPNPAYETLMQAVAMARNERIDFLLAVGGGSVIDGAKFVSAAIQHEGDCWQLVATKGKQVKRCVPVGAVLTLAATGSEMNNIAVVTRKETGDKISFAHPLLFPRFAILDPQRTLTLPARQVGNGVVDAFVHVIEQYLTYPVNSPVQDRYSEGLLLTLIEQGPRVLSEPDNYDVRANLMWAATMALNGLIAVGVPQDWSTHLIGHELTTLYGLDHAQSLAVILPAMLQAMRAGKREKLLQFAARVWGLDNADEEVRISTAITRTRDFFEQMGVRTRLGDYGVGAEQLPQILAQLERHGLTAMGERKAVTLDVAREVLVQSL